MNPSKIITVTVKRGCVQQVAGIPRGWEVHVHDHDDADTLHPLWHEEKQCFVTVYSGGGGSPADNGKLAAVREKLLDIKSLAESGDDNGYEPYTLLELIVHEARAALVLADTTSAENSA